VFKKQKNERKNKLEKFNNSGQKFFPSIFARKSESYSWKKYVNNDPNNFEKLKERNLKVIENFEKNLRVKLKSTLILYKFLALKEFIWGYNNEVIII